MSLDARLRRLEAHVHPEEVAINQMREWVQTLDIDDLRCLVALSDDPEVRTAPPEGLTPEDVKARARASLDAAPEQIRALFADSTWLKA
jgi:hypothetical protein